MQYIAHPFCFVHLDFWVCVHPEVSLPGQRHHPPSSSSSLSSRCNHPWSGLWSIDFGSGNVFVFDPLDDGRQDLRPFPLSQLGSPRSTSSFSAVSTHSIQSCPLLGQEQCYSLEFMCIPHGAWKPGFWGCFSVSRCRVSGFFYTFFFRRLLLLAVLPWFLLCFCIYGFSLAQQQVTGLRGDGGEVVRRVKTQMIYWTDSQQWILSSQVAGQRCGSVVCWMRHRWEKGRGILLSTRTYIHSATLHPTTHNTHFSWLHFLVLPPFLVSMLCIRFFAIRA